MKYVKLIKLLEDAIKLLEVPDLVMVVEGEDENSSVYCYSEERLRQVLIELNMGIERLDNDIQESKTRDAGVEGKAPKN